MKKLLFILLFSSFCFTCFGEINEKKIISIHILCSRFEHYSIQSANIDIALNRNGKSRLDNYQSKPIDGDSLLFIKSKSDSDFVFYNVIKDTIFFHSIISEINKDKKPLEDDRSVNSIFYCIIEYNDETGDYINFNHNSMIINGNFMKIDVDLLQYFFPYIPERFKEYYKMYYDLE